MMETVFEILINFYQGFLLIFFMHLRLPAQREVKWWVDAVFIGVIGCFLSLYIFPWMTLSDTFVFLIPFVYTIVTQRGNWAQRLLWTVVLAIIFITLATLGFNIYTNIFHFDQESLMANTAIRVSYVLTTNIVMTAATIIFATIGQREEVTLFGAPAQMVLVLTLLIECVTEELLYYYQMQVGLNNPVLMCASLCIFGLLILTIALYEILTQAAKSKHLSDMRSQVLTLEVEHQKEMSAFYDDMLAVQHDLRKQLDTVKRLIVSSSDVDRDAVMELLKVDKPLSIRYITGNTTVDAMLTAKHAIMEQHQINFSLQPYPLQSLPIDSAAFCILLSNIIDNAIEAVQRITDPKIEKRIDLQFARSWNVFYLTCSNTMNPSTIRKKGERFISSKTDKRIHGFGVPSIRQVVEENGGTCEITMDTNQFKIDILLPDQNENDSLNR